MKELSRANTGHVSMEDIWQALKDDDKDYQEEYW